MSIDEATEKALMALDDESMKIAEQVQAYNRKLMTPLWTKRRDILKKIPGFWGQAIGNTPMFGLATGDSDVEALENLVDFHVEYDEKNPDYRKVVATFKKNDVFKNETLTKEYTINPEEGKVLAKSTIDWHSGKEPNSKKRKNDADEDDDEFAASFVEWFADDDIRPGIMLSEEVFPNALEYYQGLDIDDDDEDDDEEIDLASEDEEDEEEEAPKVKKAKK
ncbi:uncharacterized protein BYT42DRAFT_574317 [Radiomyces spectabilis]|uniref:uncharacterized protein n=1 Tax=Radiomyces spectabilis TaxID=64574 RepID=UPI00221F8408|nr:uncharacterized protein BYT42DRAFT_574317 [Radiomyces spectabilis]KAI8376358.1 hypothetical protein BYT42DRAFT_574317 [Radiomyces spectabilis]